jgi:hypothetical protein
MNIKDKENTHSKKQNSFKKVKYITWNEITNYQQESKVTTNNSNPPRFP